MLKNALFLVSIMLLAGCASGPDARLASGRNPGISVVSNNVLPAPNRADLGSEQRPYLIGPYDKLEIDVFGIEDLSKREVQTDQSGRISFPLVGTIEAAGKTPVELEKEIESRLRRAYVRDPQVTVNLKETISQVVTVDGQVKLPGLYPVVGRMTLMRAIARAQGLAEFAKPEDVVVFRTVDGERYAGLYNLKAIRRGYYDDPEIYANDVVVVGDSARRRLFKDLLQIVPLITTPLVVALQRN